MLKPIREMSDIVDIVRDVGFLPFFENAMPGQGFSVEELCVPERWFTDDEGPWEWKGQVIGAMSCAYGKYFRGKAGFVDEAWISDLANARGGGMPFSKRWEQGGASEAMHVIHNLLEERGPLLTRELRSMGGFGRKGERGRPGFEGALTKLQMLGYVTTLDIEYDTDREGRPFGWGLARMALMSQAFPFDVEERVCGRSPQESRERIVVHLAERLPDIDPTLLGRLIDNGTTPILTSATQKRRKAGKKGTRGPIAWLAPANPRYFDLEAHLATSHELLWKQSTTILPGDEVYLYVTAPVQAVRYRFAVLETDLPASGTHEIRIDRLMRLTLIEELDGSCDRAMLERFGITHVRGPRHMPKELADELTGA